MKVNVKKRTSRLPLFRPQLHTQTKRQIESAIRESLQKISVVLSHKYNCVSGRSPAAPASLFMTTETRCTNGGQLEKMAFCFLVNVFFSMNVVVVKRLKMVVK